jgi:hypothetical protein
VGQNAGSAQWPDCSRYLEAIVIKLCEVYPSTMKQQGVATNRYKFKIEKGITVCNKMLTFIIELFYLGGR